MSPPAAPPVLAPTPPAAPQPVLPGEARRRYRMSEARYLAFEEAQTELRHEWVNGDVIEMPVATEQHEDLCLTFALMLRAAVKPRGGKAYGSNLRVRSPFGPRRYPDATAVVGPRRFEPHPRDQRLDLMNPTVVVEVLSESTADQDEGPKLVEYAAVASVTDYVLADSRSMRVVHRARTGPGAAWETVTLADPADVLNLPALGFAATLAEIYEGVEL